MRESPAPANGTSRIKTKQSAVDASENVGLDRSVTLYPLAPTDANGRPALSLRPLRRLRPAQSRSAVVTTPAAPLRREQARLPPTAERNPRPSWNGTPAARVKLTPAFACRIKHHNTKVLFPQ